MEITGFDELAEEFEDAADALKDAAGDDVKEAIDDGVETTAEAVYTSTLENVPVDQGDLRDSIELRAMMDRPLARQIVVTEDYARAVEYGRGLVVITPQNAEYLRFVVDGRVVYSKRVEQEPRPESPYLRPSLNLHRSTLEQEIMRELRRTLHKALRER